MLVHSWAAWQPSLACRRNTSRKVAVGNLPRGDLPAELSFQRCRALELHVMLQREAQVFAQWVSPMGPVTANDDQTKSDTAHSALPVVSGRTVHVIYGRGAHPANPSRR
jgi:hypothetical protein